MSAEFDELMELLKGVRITFDSGRSITHPCTFCGVAANPHHELVTIGRYFNGNSLTRPVCAGCMPIARAAELSKPREGGHDGR